MIRGGEKNISNSHEAARVFKDSDQPRNYAQPEPLNTSLTGKTAVITLTTGRTESGVIKSIGQYFLSFELTNKKVLIVSKSAIVTVAVM